MISSLQDDFTKHFIDHGARLSEISYDDDNAMALCESEQLYLDYDSIVASLYAGGNPPCSPDLIGFTQEEIIFVEFKNGSLRKKEAKQELKLKAIEGGYIAFYKAIQNYSSTISFEDLLHFKKVFCIVYNEDKNPPSRTAQIMKHLEAVPIRFGLERYKGTFYHNIKTVSSDVFMKELLPKIQTIISKN